MTEQTQSWDDFWAEVGRVPRTETVRGVAVPVPTDLPLRVVVRAEQMADSTDLDDVRSLLLDVFGDDILDALVDAGIGAMELRTLLAWATAQGSGRDVTFRDAYEMVTAADGGVGEGKAPAPVPVNRASRRATSGTGGRSKPTSAANTGSHRRASGR